MQRNKEKNKAKQLKLSYSVYKKSMDTQETQPQRFRPTSSPSFHNITPSLFLSQMETSATKLHLDQIRALKLLGKGATGTVFLVHDSVSDSSASSPFALKLVDKASASSLRRAKWGNSDSPTSLRRTEPFPPASLSYLGVL